MQYTGACASHSGQSHFAHVEIHCTFACVVNKIGKRNDAKRIHVFTLYACLEMLF